MNDGTFVEFRMSSADVISEIRKHGIEFVDLQMVDVPGKLNHVTVPSYQVTEEDLNEGFDKVDGSSLRGFTDIQDSDMIIKPDPNTFALIPWTLGKKPMARMMGDIYLNSGRGRFSRDPRYISQKAEGYLKSKGFANSLWGPEVEYFVFDSMSWDVLEPYRGQSYSISSREAAWSKDGSYPIRFKEGYYPAPPQDTLVDYRNDVASTLFEYFHLPVEAHHHEVATAGQVEVNIRRDTLTNTADGVSTLKYVAKNIAVQHGRVATMMPKPLAMDNGSGMHIHVSLWSGEDPPEQVEILLKKNLFYDETDEYAEVSQLARYFIGGLLEHSRSLCGIVAPTVNSYRRLVPGFEAPTYVAWSKANRSAIVRVPVYKTKNEASKRIEFRAPDPSCNPYLAFSAILMAGLDGVTKKLDCGEPVDENIYHISGERRRQLGISELPSSLDEALDELKSDREYLKPVFEDDMLETIIERGTNESKQVQMRPHPYEFYLYADN
jgi:glutamine synthetase